MPSARSLWFAAPRQVEIRSHELPPLADGQVLVRTWFSGISAGTELLAYRGELDPELHVDETIGALGGTFRYPFRYGYSCVGVVDESRRDTVPAGTTVFAFHPHQDAFVADGADLVPLDSAPSGRATLFPLVETALQISLDAGQVLGETVCVVGLGAVGTLTAIMLQHAGANVVALEPRPWRRDVAESLGIKAVSPDGAHVVRDESPRQSGVPLVVETSGNPDALRSALGLLAHEGTVLVASWYGTKEVSLPLGADFHRRRLAIRSTQVSTIPAALTSRWDPDRRRRAVVELLDDLPLDLLATHTVPFEEASDAYLALDTGREGVIHIALGYT